MDTARLYRCLAELNQVVNRGVELPVLLETIVRETASLLDADTTSVLLLDATRQRLLLGAAHGIEAGERERVRFSPGEGVAGWVVSHARPAVVPDAADDPRFLALPGQERRIRALIAIPLLVRGEPIGVLCATHPEPGRFDREHEALLSFLASAVVLDLENARLYRLAITDALTGLYNRQHFAERLKAEVDRAQRYRSPLGLLMIDLDGFKAVNDRHGHAAGDQVLEQVAQRTLGVTREVDLVARYGGDELVALLPSTGAPGLQRVAQRLVEAVHREPVRAGDRLLAATVSVGGAVLGPREEPRDLLARADAALYQAKSAGRDRAVLSWVASAGLS